MSKLDIIREFRGRFLGNSQSLYEMSFIQSRTVKEIPYTIWVDVAGKGRNTKHNAPRVKVGPNYKEAVPVLFDKYPYVKQEDQYFITKHKLKDTLLKQVFKYIEDNRPMFMAWWNGEWNAQDLVNFCEEQSLSHCSPHEALQHLLDSGRLLEIPLSLRNI